jgi:GNAT superfamily N-acetyltransferase
MTPFCRGFAAELAKTAAPAARSILTTGSSNVRGFRYDPATQDLFITYKSGGTYRYAGVPPAAARSLTRAKSVGKAVNKRIKGGGYAYEKVGMPATAIAKIVRRALEKDPNRVAAFIGKTRFPAAKRVALDEARIFMSGTPQFAGKRAGNVLKPVSGEFTARFGAGEGVKTANGDMWQYYADNPEKLRAKRKRDAQKKMHKAAGIPIREWGRDMIRDIVARVLNYREEKFGGHRRPRQHRKHAGVATPDGYKISRRVDEKAGDRSHDVVEIHNDGKLAGWLASHPGSDGDYVWLKSMYVAPEHRGKGLAHVLLKSAIADAPGREIRLRARPFRDESTSVEALQALYGSHGFQKLDDENRMVRYPDAATKHASAPRGAESIEASFRSMRKIAGVAKKQITWQGLRMKIEHEPGDVRSGKSKDGKTWERTMFDSYGYIPGTKGKAADGDAIDVYFAKDPEDGPVFKVRQLKKDTGEYDEDKFMVGFGSAENAKKAYLRHMPAWALGDISSVGKTFEDFKTFVES